MLDFNVKWNLFQYEKPNLINTPNLVSSKQVIAISSLADRKLQSPPWLIVDSQARSGVDKKITLTDWLIRKNCKNYAFSFNIVFKTLNCYFMQILYIYKIIIVEKRNERKNVNSFNCLYICLNKKIIILV